jgi:hypothetical protein
MLRQTVVTLLGAVICATALAAQPALADNGRGRGGGWCPPGLANKGCMPPGQAKKQYVRRDDYYRHDDRHYTYRRYDDDHYAYRGYDNHYVYPRYYAPYPYRPYYYAPYPYRPYYGGTGLALNLIIGQPITNQFVPVPYAYRYGFDPQYSYYSYNNGIFSVDPNTLQVLAFIGLASALLN